MAQCFVCGKRRIVGNYVSHSNNKVKRRILPNLQRMRVMTEKGAKRVHVCTRCLRSGWVKKAVS